VTSSATPAPQPALRVRVWRRYHASHASRWATVISWNGLFAFIPIVLVLVTLIALLLRQRGFDVALEARIVNFAQSPADKLAIRDALADFRDRSTVLVIVSILGLIWSGSALFSAIDDALSNLYGVRSRRFVRKRLRAIAMIFVFTAMMLPLLVSSSLLTAGGRYSLVPAATPVALVIPLQIVAGAIDGTLLYAVVYLVGPNRRQHLRRVLPGAAVAGVLLEGFTLLFPLYLRISGGFATYGIVFALVILLIAYFFFIGQITVIGALVNIELDPDRGTMIAAPFVS